MDFRYARRDLAGLLVNGDRLLITLLLAQNISQVHHHFDICRLQSQSAAIRCFGIGVLAGLKLGVGKPEVTLELIWRDFDCLLEARHRFGMPALVFAQAPESQPDSGIPGLFLENPSVAFLGGPEIAALMGLPGLHK